MDYFRNRPKGQYIQKADWKDLLPLIVSYNNELIYFKVDLELLVQLIDIHLGKLLLVEDLNELRSIQQDLSDSIKECHQLLQCIPIHIAHLRILVKDKKAFDSQVFRSDHEMLEDEIIKSLENFKAIRLIAQSTLNKALNLNENVINWKYN